MSKKKVFLGVGLILVVIFFTLPEVDVKSKRKEAVKYLSKEAGYPPGVSSFIVNTKLGRKLAYVGLKTELKSQLKELKKEVESTQKELLK